MSDYVFMEDMYPLILEMLEKNGSATFTVSGWSMQPMLYNRRDSVTIEKPVFPLKKFDLPFFRMNDGQFCLHRVIEVLPDGNYNCQGDNRWEPETNIRNDQIIGVVTSFTRNGKKIDVSNSFGYWLYTRTWKYLHPLKVWYNFPNRMLTKVKREFVYFKVYMKNFNSAPIVLKDGSKMNIKYRQATAKDMDDFFSLYKSFHAEEAAKFNDDNANINWIETANGKNYYQKIRKENFLWVAEADNRLIGFCCGAIISRPWFLHPTAELINIYISKDYRSYGIGGKFIDIFKDYCLCQNCKDLFVKFHENNIIANNFYNKHNFKPNKKIHSCRL